jgi:hypothetical protein
MEIEESRERHQLFAPPRVALTGEGARSVFGRDFLRLLRNSEGGCMLLVFQSVGLAILLFGVAGTVGPWRDGLRGSDNDPRFFYAMMGFGSLFFLVALRMLQIVLVGARNKTVREEKPANGKEPWRFDGWQPEMKPDYSGEGGGSVLGRVAFFGLIGFFNLAWGSPSLLLKGIVVVFDLLGLLILYDSIHQLVQALRHVRASVRWTTLPAFLGGQLQGTLFLRPAVHVHGPVRATLRCVQDEEGPADPGNIAPFQPYVVYEQTCTIPAPTEKLQELPLDFGVPKDLPGTNLRRQKAIYWQVALEIPLVGPDFETVFLAPIYAPKS